MPGAIELREPCEVGLVSDTHGLLREEALQSLTGSDLIIHAGDIGHPSILERLAQLAPVVAVRGNIDKGLWSSIITRDVVTGPVTMPIYAIHTITDLALDPVAAGIRVIVHGHSHKPSLSIRSGVIYINPGSAGPRRFRLPITTAKLHIKDGEVGIQFTNLETGGPFPVPLSALAR